MWCRYRPGVAQRVGRVTALLFHDRGTRRGWVASSTHRLHFTPGKDPIPILQEDGWATGPVWTEGKSRPHRDSIPDRPARSQSKQRIGQNKIQSNFTFMSRILYCSYFENTKCWQTYIRTVYISSIRHRTSCVFRYLVLGKWSFYLPSNQINAISLSDVHHQSPFYFSLF